MVTPVFLTNELKNVPWNQRLPLRILWSGQRAKGDFKKNNLVLPWKHILYLSVVTRASNILIFKVRFQKSVTVTRFYRNPTSSGSTVREVKWLLTGNPACITCTFILKQPQKGLNSFPHNLHTLNLQCHSYVTPFWSERAHGFYS